MPSGTIDAEPESIAIDPERTAAVMIDMQRASLEPGGFGETLGNDVSLLQAVVAQPGKSAFYATDLQTILHNRAIENLIVCGVTTEVCVHPTVREANDRRDRCIEPSDCCASRFPES